MPWNKRPDPPAIRCAEVAERQSGAIATRQMLAIGVSRSTVADWRAAGRLHPRHRGVWAFGHARLSDEGRLWAAFLATGCPFDAQTSAWCWGILDPHPDPLLIATPTRRRDTKLLRFRRTPPSPAVVDLRGLLTLPLQDTLEALPPALRRRAEANAAYAGLLPRRRGATESWLADRLAALIAAADLPPHETEYEVLGKRRDFAWPRHRLIVEADGGRAHDNPVAFERDRRRDAEALAAGWRTVRFTYEQITQDPAYVIATLRAVLAGAPVVQ